MAGRGTDIQLGGNKNNPNKIQTQDEIIQEKKKVNNLEDYLLLELKGMRVEELIIN